MTPGAQFRIDANFPRLNGPGFDYIAQPGLTALAGGGFASALDSTRPAVGGVPQSGVYVQRYDATGAAVGPEIWARNGLVGNTQWMATLAGFSTGGFVIAYQMFGKDPDN